MVQDMGNISTSINNQNDIIIELAENVDDNVPEMDNSDCTVFESSSIPSYFNYFQKPVPTKLEQFFEFHLQQPVVIRLNLLRHFMGKITFNVIGYLMILLPSCYIAVCV